MARGRWLAAPSAPLVLALGVATSGCSHEPRPWEQEGSGTAPPGAPLGPPMAPWLIVPEAGPRPGAPAAEAELAPAPPGPARPPACDAGFQSSSEPRHDVVRVGLLCGPPEGFGRERDGIEGAIAEGGATVEVPFELAAGRCYRIVAAADEGVGDLGVEVKSARDVALATHEGRGRLVVLPGASAFCSEAKSEARVFFRARSGRGRFAAEIWSRAGTTGREPGPAGPAPAIDGARGGD